MSRPARFWIGLAAVAALLAATGARALDQPSAERGAGGRITLSWRDSGPVDVYVSAQPDAAPRAARLLVRGDGDGIYQAEWDRPTRPYFILRDERDNSLTRVAERLLPLQGGSNFRDIGGYPAAGGKHVRWGRIYRTAATPMLTDADFAYVAGLDLGSVIDLRSAEERTIAPDRVPARTGALYLAHDYPASEIFPSGTAGGAPASAHIDIVKLYRTWPITLAPQFRDLFDQLLRGDKAVSYHCSAGQDRTGVATALVLSALGVPRDVILADYQLSTLDRRPQNEMPRLTSGEYPGNVVADFYMRAQAAGSAAKPKPLYEASGKPYLQETFDEIDSHWGSVKAYLKAELGVDDAKIARLRALYLD